MRTSWHIDRAKSTACAHEIAQTKKVTLDLKG